MDHKFHVNLKGIIELLSNHLYSSPQVYLRELLQNGVDAMSALRLFGGEVEGARLALRITRGAHGPVMVFEDPGVGLTEDETHQFLATIGASSKRGEIGERTDFLGQFGIGLLSCFMVSEEIVVRSRSAKGGPAVEWRGREDGTYAVRALEEEEDAPARGTRVTLTCKPGQEALMEVARVRELAFHYGGLLPVPIDVTGPDGDVVCVNALPAPWLVTHAGAAARREAYSQFAQRVFPGEEFVDAVPLESEAGGVRGVAYILPYAPSAGARTRHRVYLKGMLLSEEATGLLPDWAFFVRCVVNVDGLRPTASRESLYEDDALEGARAALGETLRSWLIELKARDPERLETIIRLHYVAMKQLATHDDAFFRLFIDWMPFETTAGRMTLGEFREQFGGPVRYVAQVDTFRQIAQVAAAQRLGVINGGYIWDAELLERLGYLVDGVEVERLEAADLTQSFEELSFAEREEMFRFVSMADVVLQQFKCRAEVKKYRPEELPALYTTSQDVQFMRTLEQSKEQSNEHWASILGSLAQAARPDSYAQLCFNYHNPLVRKLARVEARDVLQLLIQLVYVQSLLMGHHPLQSRELALLNTGLLDVINIMLDAPKGWLQ
jgi:molecular chaperone HtpG